MGRGERLNREVPFPLPEFQEQCTLPGQSELDVAHRANLAAGLVVRMPGNATVTPAELIVAARQAGERASAASALSWVPSWLSDSDLVARRGSR